MKGYVLLDAGGTEIKSAAFTDSGKQLDDIHSVPSCAQAEKETILENLITVIVRENDILAANGYQIGKVGLAFPGPFDYPKGISHMKGLAKYDAIEGVPLEEALKSFPGQKVLQPDVRFFFRHDVDSFALGAAFREPSCKVGRILCLCIGTGSGSAFLENGRLLKQDPRIPDNGWIYPFPFHGSTIDDWISVRGLKRLTCESGFPAGTSGKDLFDLAVQENRRAAAVWKTFGIFIADALQPFVDSFRPHQLILGGQVSKAERFFGDEMRKRYPELSIRHISDTTECILLGLLASDRGCGACPQSGKVI